MNLTPRRIRLLLLPFLAIAPGCKHGPDRQIVYPARRGTQVQVDNANGVRVKAPGVDVRVPPEPPLDPSHGVDVPMIEPE